MSGFPVLDPLDRRLVIFDSHGCPIETAGTPAIIGVAFTELHRSGNFDSAIDSQLVFGEPVMVFDTANGWARVQSGRDLYVGWLETSTLRFDAGPATHQVCVPRTFFYPEPDLKKPHKGIRSMGSEMRVIDEVETRNTHYAILSTGEAVFAGHIRALGIHDSDFVSVAESLISTPYLWAGTTAFGIDCSGLVKLAKWMCGEAVLRDTDMQAATIGEAIDAGSDFENVKRGDLVFWRGHVGIVQGKDENDIQRILHASGHAMRVVSEPLSEAVMRISYLYEEPIGVRRPIKSGLSRA